VTLAIQIGCLLINLRLFDGLMLKEKRWTFMTPEEAESFQRLIGAMNAVGPLVKEIFAVIDRDNKGYIDVVDLDVAVEEYCQGDPEFTEGSTFLMIDECFTGTEPGKVRLGTVLALMISSNVQRVQSIQTLLHEWLHISSERINTLFAYRDSRILYDDDVEDVDFDDYDYDDEMEEFRSLLERQNEADGASLNSAFSGGQPSVTAFSGKSRDESIQPSTSVDGQHRSVRRRMSVRSMKVHKSIMKATPTVSIISKPRSSACTTGTSVTDILGGEIVLNTLHQVFFTLGPPNKDRVGYKDYRDGTLLLTNYRIVVADATHENHLNQRHLSRDTTAGGDTGMFRYGAPTFPTMFSIPLAAISRVELESEGSLQGYELAVVCKDFRILRLSFAGNAVETFPSFFRDVLSSCAFVPSQQDLFCFKATKLNPADAGNAAAALVKEAAVAMLERNRSNTVTNYSVLQFSSGVPSLPSHPSNNSQAIITTGINGTNRSRCSDDPSSLVLSALLAGNEIEADKSMVGESGGACHISPFTGSTTNSRVSNDSPSTAAGTAVDPSCLVPIERSQSESMLTVNHKPTFSLLPPRRSESTGTNLCSAFRNSRIPSEGSFNGVGGISDGWNLFDPAYEYFRLGLLPHPDYAISSGKSPSQRMHSIQINNLYNSSLPGGDAGSANMINIPGGPFWRLWSDNYQLVDTYPSAFILPSALTDREVFDAAMFRSRCRLPALTWRDPMSGACLVRSSQPMSGISSQTNVADKLLLNRYIMRGTPHDPREQKCPSIFYVIDCRSQLAANANAAFGKGVENWKALVNTRVSFCNIGNIHTMRSSLESLHKVLMPWVPGKSNKTTTALTLGGLQILSSIKKAFSGKDTMPDANSSTVAGGDASGTSQARTTSSCASAGNVNSSGNAAYTVDGSGYSSSNYSISNELDARFLMSRIEDTGWLEHIRLVLQGSVLVAEKLSLEGCSVLVHCSDGWDRTAQVRCYA
jgi:hypothetical protein